MKHSRAEQLESARTRRKRLLAAQKLEHCREETRPLCELIEAAFREVTLEDGIGLWEGQGLDDYADGETMAAYRERDIRNDWRDLSPAEMNRCNSSLCFFDAKGMRFHLPAFLIAELQGTYECGIIFHLTDLSSDYSREKFVLLAPEQRAAVCAFLEYAVESTAYEYDHVRIRRALKRYWMA